MSRVHVALRRGSRRAHLSWLAMMLGCQVHTSSSGEVWEAGPPPSEQLDADGPFDGRLHPSTNAQADASGPQPGDAQSDGERSTDGELNSADGGSPDALSEPVRFDESVEPFASPERGFYRFIDVLGTEPLDFVHLGGDSLAYSSVRLDAYRESDLPTTLLDALDVGLARVRSAGIKVILRFVYNDGPYPDSERDASLERILNHIQQLTPVLRRNEDVIAIVQAGFIGAWGEWHSSTHGLDTDPEARRTVLTALLAALPDSRMTQVRYPPHKAAMFGAPPNERSDGPAARVGHHNDCFLASDTDYGTYPPGERETWLSYLERDTRFVPIGGETCAVSQYSGCTNAMSEMARLRYAFIHRDYSPGVVTAWQTEGCLDEIDRHLGYRFVARDGELPSLIEAGGSFRVRLRIENTGWAAPFNPREFRIVLANSASMFSVRLPEIDLRDWGPGQTQSIDIRLRAPTDLREGSYVLAAWLPDPAPSIRNRAEYAIRFANTGVWDSARGWNVIGSVEVRGREMTLEADTRLILLPSH